MSDRCALCRVAPAHGAEKYCPTCLALIKYVRPVTPPVDQKNDWGE